MITIASELSFKEKTFLKELIKNHYDHPQDPSYYITQKKIAQDYDIPKSTVNYNFKKLKEKNLIRKHEGKTKELRRNTCDKSKVFILTKKGIEVGGLSREFEKITEGPNNSPLKSTITLADLHGDLSISFQVNKVPEDDGLEWKVNQLKNGVKQKIRTVYYGGDRISIELFEGKEKSRVVLKPRLIAGQHDTPESLLNAFREAAYGIRTDLEMAGYRLGLPEEKGEGKFTLRSKVLSDIGYLESENTLFDQSQGMQEIHPRTGDIESNKLMTEIVTTHEMLEDRLDPLPDSEKIKILDDIGELSKMVTSVKRFNNKLDEKLDPVEQRQDLLAKNQQVIAQSVKQLADDFNRFMEKIERPQTENMQPDIPEDPGGRMYG